MAVERGDPATVIDDDSIAVAPPVSRENHVPACRRVDRSAISGPNVNSRVHLGAVKYRVETVAKPGSNGPGCRFDEMAGPCAEHSGAATGSLLLGANERFYLIGGL